MAAAPFQEQQPGMRWEVRNTFLEFYDDDEAHWALRSHRRSPSAPAVMARGSFALKVEATKPKLCRPVAASQGGGLRRVQVSQPPVQQPSMQAPAPRPPLQAAASPRPAAEGCLALEPVGYAAEPSETDASPGAKSKRKRRRCKGRPTSESCTGLLAAQEAGGGPLGERTVTVMVRHIACCYTLQQVTAILDDLGLKGKYHFAHLPLNSKKTANLGYFFVNLSAQEHVDECRAAIEGQVFGPSRTTKKCEVAIAHMQGYAHLLAKSAPQVQNGQIQWPRASESQGI